MKKNKIASFLIHFSIVFILLLTIIFTFYFVSKQNKNKQTEVVKISAEEKKRLDDLRVFIVKLDNYFKECYKHEEIVCPHEAKTSEEMEYEQRRRERRNQI